MILAGGRCVAGADAGEALLVDRARAGDGEAFGLLVRPHLEALYAFARKVGPGTDAAADIAQETLIRARPHLDGYRADGPFRSWLFAIAWRAAHTEGSPLRRLPLPKPPEELPEGPNPEAGPEDQSVARRPLAAGGRGSGHPAGAGAGDHPAGRCDWAVVIDGSRGTGHPHRNTQDASLLRQAPSEAPG